MDIAFALLQYYSFDLGDLSIEAIAGFWREYDPIWVRLAIVESLYRGRYKAVSVSQILEFWERRGEPHCRFSREFERLVCGDFVSVLPSLPLKVTYTSFRPSAQDTRGRDRGQQSIPASRSQADQSEPQRLLSPTYQTAMQQMSLLADSSLFVDKLKSMCTDSHYDFPDTEDFELTEQLASYTDI
jgi:hypothetical protein